MNIYIIFILIMNIIAFALYGSDKAKAKKNQWRISERTLLLVGLFGGAVGALSGMIFFHHKTRKKYFWFVNIIGVLLLVYLIIRIMFQT